MKVVDFNERFEISEKPNNKGIYRIYDYYKQNYIGILFDRFSSAIEWLESKGFHRV